MLREPFEVRRVHEAHLARLFERPIPGPSVAHDATDEPERADANRRRAMNERGPVRRVVGDFEELVDLRGRRLPVDDRNVEVPEPRLLHGLPFFVGAMLTRRPEIHDGADTLRLQPSEVLVARLSACAEVGRDANEIANRRRLERLWG